MNIMSNIAAMNAHSNLKTNQNERAKLVEKLSSGYRINKAADDAAGLAISENMRYQIKGTQQAARNVQDGISLIQTAEGGMNEIHAMLQRMNTLANQASNGTYQNEDRDKLDLEFQQLKREINNVANNSNFNGIKLLDGEHSITNTDNFTQISGSKILTGNIAVSGNNDTFNFDLDDGPFSITLSHGNFSVGDFINNINDQLAVNDIDMVAYLSQDKLMFNRITPGDFKINEVTGNGISHMIDIQAGSPANSYLIAGRSLLSPSITITSGVNDTLTFDVAGTEYSITLTEGTYFTPLHSNASTTPLGIEINNQLSTTGLPIRVRFGGYVGSSHPIYGNDLYSATLTMLGEVPDISNVRGTARETLFGDAGPGIAGGGSPSVIMGVPNMLNGIEIINGKNNELQLEIAGTSKSFVLTEGNYTATEFINQLNTELASDNIVASIVNGRLRLAQNEGVNITVGEGALVKELFLAYKEGEKIESEPQGIGIQKGYEANDILILDMPNVTASSIEISSLSIFSTTDASNAITYIESAINEVASERAKLGAYQNRLEHVLNNLHNSFENLSAAHSRIRDTDMAQEMTNLTKNQIISEAGQAMLAQANALPQSIIKLLG